MRWEGSSRFHFNQLSGDRIIRGGAWRGRGVPSPCSTSELHVGTPRSISSPPKTSPARPVGTASQSPVATLSPT